MPRIIIDRRGIKAAMALQRMRPVTCKVCGTLYSQRQHGDCPKCKEKHDV